MEIDLTETLKQGMAAHQAGDLETAGAAYARILDAAPGHADALHLSGLIAHQQGDNDGAIELISRAIAMDGKVALYHANLGRVQKARGDDPAAVAAFRDAVHLEPETASLHADLASALLGAGDADAARARANLAIGLDPMSGEAHVNLGLALQELYGPAHGDAVAAFRRAIDIAPQLPGAYLGLGLALHESGERDGAKRAYAAAIAANPGFVEAHCNLGNLARDEAAFDAAVGHYRHALDLDPEQPHVWGNLAVALQEMGDLDAALRAYDRAVELLPGDPDIRRNRGMALLARGHFIEGWRDYEFRWQTARFRQMQRDWPVPVWGGGDLTGKRILVHAEQGLGDTLQFCRYLPLLRKLEGDVVFECADSLRPLIAPMPGAGAVIAPGTGMPRIDCHVPLLSLPGLFGTTATSVPDEVPYLSAPAGRIVKWRAAVADWPPGMKIGIAWRGSADHPRDALRSPGLAPFMALADLENVTLVSLQKQDGAAELASTPGAGKIIDLSDDLADFADTAAVIAHLDVVVSCDSAPLHLAGALGARAVAVLPHVAEWRWAQDDTTPWYPSMTLVRQPAFGDWEGVFEAVAGLLGK